MPFNQALVSRRFVWRLTILATVLGVVMALFLRRWDKLMALPFSVGAIAALHPLMDKNVPTLVDGVMFRQRRTWVGIAFLVMGFLIMLSLHFHLLA
jgi:hypothetical protein